MVFAGTFAGGRWEVRFDGYSDDGRTFVTGAESLTTPNPVVAATWSADLVATGEHAGFLRGEIEVLPQHRFSGRVAPHDPCGTCASRRSTRSAGGTPRVPRSGRSLRRSALSTTAGTARLIVPRRPGATLVVRARAGGFRSDELRIALPQVTPGR